MVLALLDQLLIPSAEDAELRAELTTTRGEVEMHLKRAEQIKAALGAP
jgi:predicted outer membrane protein